MSEGGATQVREQAKKGYFDRFAQRSAELVSKAPFFTFCVLLVVVWAPTIVLVDFDTWQLLINTPTTIITFLLVALLQNTQPAPQRAGYSQETGRCGGWVSRLDELLRGRGQRPAQGDRRPKGSCRARRRHLS